MPNVRKDTRRRKAKRGGTRRMLGGAGASPIELVAGVFKGLSMIAVNESYSEEDRNRVKILIGLLAVTIFTDATDSMVGGGGMGGNNAGTGKGAGTSTALAAPSNVRRRANAATQLLLAREASAERAAAGVRGQATATSYFNRQVLANGALILVGFAATYVGTTMRAPVPAGVPNMGENMALVAAGAPLPPAPAPAPEGNMMSTFGRGGLIGGGLLAVLAGIRGLFATRETHAELSRDATMVGAPSGAHAQAIAAADSVRVMAREQRAAQTAVAERQALATVAAAAIGGASNTAVAGIGLLTATVTEGARGVAGVAGATAAAAGAVGSSALEAAGGVASAGFGALGSALTRPSHTYHTHEGSTIDRRVVNVLNLGDDVARRMATAPLGGAGGAVASAVAGGSSTALVRHARANMESVNY